MNEIKINSTCVADDAKLDAIWSDTLKIDKIMFDPNLFESHKNRINKVFATASDEVKEQQLQNILMRDTLFNKAMDKLVSCFTYNIDKNDINEYAKLIKASLPKDPQITEEEMDNKVLSIAEKLVQKELVFMKIAEKYNISVDAKETLDVLGEYNKSTGNSIDDIKNDKVKLTGAVNALLEEKITAFIINKFEKNFDELYKNMQLDAEARAKAEEKEKKSEN